jgi:hydrogenase-4 component F
MGIFMSEFLIVTSTMAKSPWLAIALVAGLLIGFGGLLRQLNAVAFGEPGGNNEPSKASFLPLFVHLALVLTAGIYLPPALVHWFQSIAVLLG